jgi:hypothetical protein
VAVVLLVVVTSNNNNNIDVSIPMMLMLDTASPPFHRCQQYHRLLPMLDNRQ